MTRQGESQDPYVIIGSGAAGVAALQGIREIHPEHPIVAISHESHAFYSKPGLAYWLTGQIPEKQLYPQLPEYGRDSRLTRWMGEVQSIDPATRSLRLDNGKGLRYKRLLLATGAQAIRPKMEGIDLKGVVTLDTLEDVRGILKLARRAKRAVVVGGGITALELAEGLCARGVETHYLLRKDRYWGNVLDEVESQMVQARLEEEGVRIHYQAEIERIEGKKDHVAGVILHSGERIACTIVGLAIGIRPRTRLAEGAGLEVERGIIVDEHFRTSAESIFAAGDVAQVWDPETSSHVLDSLWWIAREQGRIAGRNMAGANESYQRKTPFNVTRIGGITTTLIGRLGGAEVDEDLVAIARGDSETFRTSTDVFAIKEEHDQQRVRLMIGERNIQGALVMGDQTLSRPLQYLITEQVDIGPIKARLMSHPEEMASLIQSLWAEREDGIHA